MTAQPLRQADPAPDAAQAPQRAFAREPILDARNAIFGYELSHAGADPGGSGDAELLAQALELADHRMLAGRRSLFVRCAPATLATDALTLLDPDRLVLDVRIPQAIDAAAIQSTAECLAGWRAKGFRLAFPHEVLASAWRAWLPHPAFLKIDFARLPRQAVPAIVKAARPHASKLIACGIDTAEAHELAVSLGLDLFQGRWFAQPVLLKQGNLRPGQATILQLVGLLRREAELADIEALLKRDAALTFNLLRFINSGAFGLAGEVSSFRNAVMMLGLQRLLRWATLLLATSCAGAPALGHTAVVRGRLMELLAAELLKPEQCDQAFVVGVFSLLPAMTGTPMERALDGLNLPEPVNDALLHRRGLFEPFLALTEACEHADDEAFGTHCERLLLSGRQVNLAHLQALAWAEEMLGG
jgi:EAL and modified HD-GYP domain-containing signal transduction protein